MAAQTREKIGAPRRVLLMQDDATSAEGILHALRDSRDESFEVEWVRRCADGLERLTGIEAILVDLHLPDSCGLATFDRLHRMAPTVPILVLIDPHDEDLAKLAVQ
jgi:DNA-binding response OmpR family regulator